jgi:transcriptional regulator with XRE-family HTH domain
LDWVTFGARIRSARERAGLSQEDLAIRVKKSQRAISLYETGKRKMYADDLLAFAKILDISVIFLLTGEENQVTLDELLLGEYHRLSNREAKQAALHLLRTFCDYVGSEK